MTEALIARRFWQSEDLPDKNYWNSKVVTVQIVTVPRGVGLQVQADPETAGRQTEVFVTVKPERLNCYVK